MATLIQNGTVVNATESILADVLMDGGKIVQVGVNLPAQGAQVVDAAGKYVLPGGIDVHTHLELAFGGTYSSDDFYTGHKAAAFGGTTTHLDFAIQSKGESLHQTIERWNQKARDKAVVDYGYHLGVTDLTPEVMEEIPTLIGEGITTLKLFMAYKGLFQVDDTTLFRALMKAAEAGMMVMVHAENGDVVDALVKDAIAAGHTEPVWHALTRPDWAEAEATARAVFLAAIAGAPLYVVHVTNAKAVDQIAYGRAHGTQAMGETCVQYLFFTEDDLRRPDGSKYVCSPPMRTRADNEALWEAIRDNKLQVVSTDHCPFLYEGGKEIMYEGKPFKLAGKELGNERFDKIPNGLPAIEDRMPILWSYGVDKGRISMNRFVELCCTNPAKIFGLYPRKGVVAPGADADVVIWNPGVTRTWGVATSHQRTDYNLWEGWQVTSIPEKVFLRGNLLVDGDTWNGEPGGGEYVRRTPRAAVV